MLLVSNVSDNALAVDGIADTALVGDRTFVVKLGSNVSVQYAGKGDATKHIEKRETVPVLKYVDVNVTVMRAKPAPGGMDLPPDQSGVDTRGYMTKAAATEWMNFVNEQFAQIGVQLRSKNGIQYAEQPGIVDLSDSLSIGMTAVNGEMVPEQKALYSGIATRTPAVDDIELIFVNAIFNWDYVNAKWVEDDFVNGVATPIDIAPRIGNLPDNSVADTVTISINGADMHTVAHELGHILTQLGHARRAVPNGDMIDYEVPVAAANLMESGDGIDDTRVYSEQTVFDSKRLITTQRDRIALRTTLLKPY